MILLGYTFQQLIPVLQSNIFPSFNDDYKISSKKHSYVIKNNH